MKKRIIILGAGLAGLSTAWHLQRLGIDCQLFEKEKEVGGLCRSKKINGFTFDCDGHLLHFKHNYTLSLIKYLLGENIIRHKRSAWIYSFGRFSRYPFQANLYGLPTAVAKNCLLEFIKIHSNGFKANNGSSFRQWIDMIFGKGIAQYFMVPYNTKFWTVPLDDLTCEWIDGFIPIPTLNQIIEGTIRENRRNLGYNAFFWYPEKGGIREVALGFANQIKNIYLDCPVTEINLKRKEIILNGKQKVRFDVLVSTAPLPEIPHLISRIPKYILPYFKRLRWNSIFNLNLGIKGKHNFSRHWVYFPEKEFSFFRVGFPSNFSPYLAPCDKSSIYVEVAYSADKSIDKNKIILSIKKDLKKSGILTKSLRICLEDTNYIKYAYPIYDNNYQGSREKILRFLIQNNIIPCGRYSSWRYMSMEDVILNGKDIAERIFNKPAICSLQLMKLKL